MQKATISARSGRRSGGCCAFEKRAKPDAKSDDFGAVWTQVRRLLRFLEAFKTDAKSDDFGNASQGEAAVAGGCIPLQVRVAAPHQGGGVACRCASG